MTKVFFRIEEIIEASELLSPESKYPPVLSSRDVCLDSPDITGVVSQLAKELEMRPMTMLKNIDRLRDDNKLSISIIENIDGKEASELELSRNKAGSTPLWQKTYEVQIVKFCAMEEMAVPDFIKTIQENQWL